MSAFHIISDFGYNKSTNPNYIGLLSKIPQNIGSQVHFDNRDQDGILGPWIIERLDADPMPSGTCILIKTTNTESSKQRLMFIYQEESDPEIEFDRYMKMQGFFNFKKRELNL